MNFSKLVDIPERLALLFQSIVAERQDDLLTLSRNPFNLRLVGDLLGSGTSVNPHAYQDSDGAAGTRFFGMSGSFFPDRRLKAIFARVC